MADRMVRNPEAVALSSGGLDSALAVRLILDCRTEVEEVIYVTPFLNRRGKCQVRDVAHTFGIPCKTTALSEELFQVERDARCGLTGAG